MTLQPFSWHAHQAGSYGVPADWREGRCQVLLTTGYLNAVDEFRLVEVAVAARRILAECVPISKTRLGGLMLVGNRQGYFVAVNGPALEEEGREGGRVVEIERGLEGG